MLSSDACARLATKFPTNKNDHDVKTAAWPNPQCAGARPSVPRTITPPPQRTKTFEERRLERKALSDSIQLLKETYQSRHKPPQGPATDSPRHVSNLYQAISPSSILGKSTFTLSRGDSDKRLNRQVGSRQTRAQAHLNSSTYSSKTNFSRPSYAVSVSSRRLHREDDDDGGLDQPTVPCRERNFALAQNTSMLAKICTTIQAHQEKDESMSSRSEGSQAELIHVEHAGEDNWSYPSRASIQSFGLNSVLEQDELNGSVNEDQYSTRAESMQGSVWILEQSDSSEVGSSISFEYEKENSELDSQVARPEEDGWPNGQKETPSENSTPSEPKIISMIAPLDQSLPSDSLQFMDDDSAPPHVAKNERKTEKRKKVTAQNSFLDGNLSQMGSLYFGNKPTFRDSTGYGRKLSLLKNNPRKIIDKHLRILGAALGQTLSLNRRGICYFYFEELFVHLEVPEDLDDHSGGCFMVDTVVHQLIPGKGDHVNLDQILDKVQDLERASPEPVSVTVRNKRKITLSCTRNISQVYEDFLKCMKDFKEIAVQMKEQLRPATPLHPYPQIVEF